MRKTKLVAGDMIVVRRKPWYGIQYAKKFVGFSIEQIIKFKDEHRNSKRSLGFYNLLGDDPILVLGVLEERESSLVAIYGLYKEFPCTILIDCWMVKKYFSVICTRTKRDHNKIGRRQRKKIRCLSPAK